MRRIKQMIEELILAEKDKIGTEEADKRITALRELDAYKQSGDQFSETMTIAHFSSYFQDALSRMFYEQYQLKQGAWKSYTTSDTTPDFRDVKRFRMTLPGTLLRRREKAEAKATDICAGYIQYGVEEFARQFDVSWQTIINDDLGEIQKTPQRMLQVATMFEDQFVSALYDNATTQATLAGLGAPYAGTGRLTAANLAIGVNGMRVRPDPSGNYVMNIRTINLIIPPVLEPQARMIMASSQLPATALNDANVIRDYIANIYVDPYIATAGADIPWYLFAGPSEIPTVTVARLDGAPGPFVMRKRSNIEMLTGSAPAAFMLGNIETGDIEYVVEDIIGGWDDASMVGVTDFRGIYYSSGTTP